MWGSRSLPQRKLKAFLESVQLAHRADAFACRGITSENLCELTPEEFSALDIESEGERRRLEDLIEMLRMQPTVAEMEDQDENVDPAAPICSLDTMDRKRGAVSTPSPAVKRSRSTPPLPEEELERLSPVASARAILGMNECDSQCHIKVCVRKRPLSRKEAAAQSDVLDAIGTDTLHVLEPRVRIDLTKYTERHEYVFDQVFHESCSNWEVYCDTARPLIPTIFDGARATCFAYGQTGSGKTYTMCGTKGDGIYSLAGRDIFRILHSSTLYENWSLVVSFFEIYGGKLYDLLDGHKKVLCLENSKGEVCIQKLREVELNTPEDLQEMIEQGGTSRSTGVTSANEDSSRSHAILQIALKDMTAPRDSQLRGKFSFIDLAGSERATDTAATDRQTRLEGAEINKSLLALKECIRALDQAKRHTPFRQSKLTQVLKDSFISNSRTVMIANLSPNSAAVEHTLNTLRYADRVKELGRTGGARQTTRVSGTREVAHTPPVSFRPANSPTPSRITGKRELIPSKRPHAGEGAPHHGLATRHAKSPPRATRPNDRARVVPNSPLVVPALRSHAISVAPPRPTAIPRCTPRKAMKQRRAAAERRGGEAPRCGEAQHTVPQLREDECVDDTRGTGEFTLLADEDELVCLHRTTIDGLFKIVRKEVTLLNEVEDPSGSLHNYVHGLVQLLDEKSRMMDVLRSKALELQARLHS